MKPAKFRNFPAMSDFFSPRYDRFFNEAFNFMNDPADAMAEFSPKADIVEKDKSYEVVVSIPGMKKEDVKIELNGDVLTISGERKQSHKEENDKVIRTEIHYGRFSRSFRLNNHVDRAAIKAEFSDGLLRLSLPKSQMAVSQTIEIK